MATDSEALVALAEGVLSQARKMRDLLRTIESETAPLNEVVPALAKLGEEIDALVTLANEATGRRPAP
jgi:hypothetical protein